MIAEKKIFNMIPGDLDPSWVVSYLNTDQFTSGHVRVLRDKAKTSDKVLSSLLNLAPKTFVSYTKDISKIKIDTKEHVLLLISLFKRGSEVFGSEDNFSRWLDSNNVFLDNKKPLSFLNTTSGIRIINDRLVAIEYGDNI